MSSGHYIRKLAAGGGNDTPGDWAKMVNNLYEVNKQPIVNDVWQAPREGGGFGTFAIIARYRMPTEHLGTGLTGVSAEVLRL